MKQTKKNTLDLIRSKRIFIWAIYLAFIALYALIFGQEFLENWLEPNYLIAPIMAFGSFVAGSTFLGGGAIAFPALTKILAIDPITAKTFSLAIQSIGMSSASLYIIVRITALPFAFILLYVLGSAAGIFLSLSLLQNHIPSIDLRIGFTLFLLCFLAVYLFTRHSTFTSTYTALERTPRDIFITLLGGVLGGVLSGLLGSGADLVGFCLLVMYFRVEIKRATQISVLLMAATSIIGISIQGVIFDHISNEVAALWFIAAPVVVIGAPLGALCCRKMSTQILLMFICTIVAVEVLSTLLLVPIDLKRVAYYGLGVLISLGMILLFRHQSRIKHS